MKILEKSSHEDSRPSPMIQLEKVIKTYQLGTVDIPALRGIDLSVEKGEFISIMGPSGSGKTTLLNLLGGLDQATSGSVILDGEDLGTLKEEELTLLRRQKIGFVFQAFNLMPTLTALENVCLPSLLDGVRFIEAGQRGRELLWRVGLSHRVDHKPEHMSGGEIQRVALARALMMDPVVILADEPTGNLDNKNGLDVLELLKNLVQKDNVTLVMVTHNIEAAMFAERIIHFKDGKILREEKVADHESKVAMVSG